MSIKYVVFDWDGTLADTYSVISAAYDHTFDTLGLPRIPYDELKRLTSAIPNKDMLAHLFGERKTEAAKAYYSFIDQHHTSALKPISGARRLLDYCQKHHITCLLITNKKNPYITAEVKQLGFADFFHKIIAAGEYAEDKPHPLAVHAAFDGILPPADEILVLGDGEADVQTAAAYAHDGQKAFCVIYDPKGNYKGSQPDCKIQDLRQVIDIIGEHND